MSVLLAQPLPVIAFSRNKIALQVLSSNYLANTPAIAVNTLTFSAAIAANTAVVLSWNNTSTTLTSKVLPDDSGEQFPTGAGDGPYVQSLVSFFQGNYFIDKYYIVTADITGANPLLKFTARSPGPEYNFSTFSASGITCAVLTPGVTNQPIANFAHHIEAFIKNPAGNIDQKTYEANVALDIPLTGATTLDLGEEVLHSFLTSDEPVLSAPYEQCRNSIRQYFVKYAQFYGQTPSVKQVHTSPVAVVAKGGLGMQAQLTYDIVSKLNPVAGQPDQNLFCRLGSKNKLIGIDQPEWLTYINLTTSDIVASMEVTIYNDDTTTVTFNAVTALSIPAYTKFQFRTGYTQLDIGGKQAPGKLPIYYTVRLNTAAGYVTDTYAFVIDYTFYQWPRYFVYENSFGAYQTIATIGKGQGEFSRSKDTGQLAKGKAEAAIDGEFIETNILIQDKGTVNIGYKRAGRRNTVLLRDLLLSPKVYLYENSALIPVGLNTDQLKDAMDGQNPYANSFEYYPLYQQNVFSEAAGELDDTVNDLLLDSGYVVPTPPTPVPDPALISGTIVVDFGDPRLSIVGGSQKYMAPYWLTGKTNYRVYSTQMQVYFRTADISYNSTDGSFTILVPGFVLQFGDQLIIFPFILNP